MSDLQKATVDALELTALVLDECNVTRGEGDISEPGKVETAFDITASRDDDGDPFYVVTSEHVFLDPSGEKVATIEVSFAAAYAATPGTNLPDDQVEAFGTRMVMTHVIPFMREFLASMTNRMGLAPFYLPLFRPRQAQPIADTGSSEPAPDDQMEGKPRRRRRRAAG